MVSAANSTDCSLAPLLALARYPPHCNRLPSAVDAPAATDPPAATAPICRRCREAVVEAAKILNRVHDEESKPFELEMSWICDESGREHQRVPADVLAAAQAAAKAALQDSDMED